jgi:MFS family permease
MLTSFAIGGILGAVLASVWKVRRKGWLMLIGSAILGSCLAAAGILARLWLVGASLVLMGISAGLVNLHIVSWIQQRVEAAMRGRVMSVLMFASVGLVPVSLAVAGAVAQWNVRALFLLAGCATAVSSALAARLRSLRDIGIDAVPTPETAASAG